MKTVLPAFAIPVLAGILSLSASAALGQEQDETTIFTSGFTAPDETTKFFGMSEDQYEDYGIADVDNVFTHGVPSAEDLDSYKEKGVRVVFDLRGPTEKPAIEEMVNKKGMVYHQIPYLKEGNIDGESIAKVDKLLSEFEENNPGMKFLVHCASSNRAGSWFAIHFKKRTPDASIDDAIEAGKKAGLKSEGLIAKTKKYLEEMGY